MLEEILICNVNEKLLNGFFYSSAFGKLLPHAEKNCPCPCDSFQVLSNAYQMNSFLKLHRVTMINIT